MVKRVLSSALALCAAAVLTACTCSSGAPAPRDTAADLAQLNADAAVWFDYYAKADGPAMASLYAPDALLMPPGADRVQGREAIGAYLGKDAEGAKAAGFAIQNVAVTGSGVSGDLGWVSGTYVVTDASGTEVDSGSYLSVHRREGDKWPYIRDIWNSDRPPVPAPIEAPSAQ